MKVERYTIKNIKDKQRGLLIAEDENWILIKHIPVDYAIDGYKVFSKKFVQKRKSKGKEKQIEQVLRLRNIEANKPNGFEFGTAMEILQWCEKKYGQFEFKDRDEDIVIGRIKTFIKNGMTIDFINTDGSVDLNFDYEFSIDEIRVITFEADYFNAIQLLREHQISKKN